MIKKVNQKLNQKVGFSAHQQILEADEQYALFNDYFGVGTRGGRRDLFGVE